MVINIERFTPEEVKVFLVEEENTVFVVADKKEVERGTGSCDHFEQKISLPSDVDPTRLTSGISQVGTGVASSEILGFPVD